MSKFIENVLIISRLKNTVEQVLFAQFTTSTLGDFKTRENIHSLIYSLHLNWVNLKSDNTELSQARLGEYIAFYSNAV